MPHPIDNSTLRIIHPNGKTAGTGFLVAKDLAVTCAHVIFDADGCAGSTVQVQFTGQAEQLDALVEPDFWSDVDDKDVAILKIDNVPEKIVPLRLGHAGLCKLDAALYTFGYATAADEDKLSGSGKFVNWSQDSKVFQFRMHEADHGHSGAPVLDVENNVIIGMIQKGERGIIFATPTETLWQVCPLLELANPFLPLEALIEIFSQDYVQQTECDIARRTLENVISNLQPSSRNRHLGYPLKDKIQICLSELEAFRKICRFRYPETDLQRKNIKEKLNAILRDMSKL